MYSTSRVANHWRQTPEYKELEFRWVPEGVTRLATLIAGEAHISDIDRALQKDASDKGMKIVAGKLTAIGPRVALRWYVLCHAGEAGQQATVCR